MYRSNFFLLTLLALAVLISAQETRTFTFDAANTFFLKELTAVVQKQNDKIVFEMIPEQVLQQDKFKGLDLKKGDEIIFINGKKVKELSDLRNVYDALEVGKEIKLGIKRDKEQFFAVLTKEEQPAEGGHMMIMTTTTDGPAEDGDGKVIMDGKKVNLDSLKKSNNVLVVPQKKKKGN